MKLPTAIVEGIIAGIFTLLILFYLNYGPSFPIAATTIIY